MTNIAIIIVVVLIAFSVIGQNDIALPAGINFGDGISFWLVVGLLAVVGALFLPEEPKRFMPWVKGAIAALGVLLMLLTLNGKTELFNSVDREIEEMNECSRTNTCPDSNNRSPAIPTYQTGGEVTLRRNNTRDDSLVFSITGKVTLINVVDCRIPRINSQDPFEIENDKNDTRKMYIWPTAGEALMEVFLVHYDIPACAGRN